MLNTPYQYKTLKQYQTLINLNEFMTYNLSKQNVYLYNIKIGYINKLIKLDDLKQFYQQFIGISWLISKSTIIYDIIELYQIKKIFLKIYYYHFVYLLILFIP